MAENLKPGDKVSWKWGSNHPTGKVMEIVEEGKAQVTSKKGNTVTRNPKEGDPAVMITDTKSGNDVVKLAHEVKNAEVDK